MTPDVAREACQRLGSKAVLSGSISRLGSHYVIGLNAVNCKSGESLDSELAEAESRERVLKALHRSVGKLREKLGESLASIRKYDAPIEQATTPSLEALQAYSMGVKTRSQSAEAAAIPYFKRAIELDPKFAMAYARLGSVYNNLSEMGLASQYATKAYDLRERVSEREKLYIETHYYIDVTGELEKAMQVYLLEQQIYPDDPLPYHNLDGIYIALGQHEKALAQALTALRLDPDSAMSYANAAFDYQKLDRLKEAEELLDRAKTRNLDTTLSSNRYAQAFLRGDDTEMERLFANSAGTPAFPDLALEHSDTAAYRGQMRRARELSQQSVEAVIKSGDTETAAVYRAQMGIKEVEVGNLEKARDDVIAALALPSTRDGNVLSAMLLARIGDVQRAQRMAEQLNKSHPLDTILNNYWLPAIGAAIELKQDRPTRAVQLLQSASPYDLGAPYPLNATGYPPYLRGEAYLRIGEGREAAAEFEKLVNHSGLFFNFPLAALAKLGLARAHAMVGDTAGARRAYQDFFSVWKSADSDVPILKQAQVEYARLKSIPQ